MVGQQTSPSWLSFFEGRPKVRSAALQVLEVRGELGASPLPVRNDLFGIMPSCKYLDLWGRRTSDPTAKQSLQVCFIPSLLSTQTHPRRCLSRSFQLRILLLNQSTASLP